MQHPPANLGPPLREDAQRMQSSHHPEKLRILSRLYIIRVGMSARIQAATIPILPPPFYILMPARIHSVLETLIMAVSFWPIFCGPPVAYVTDNGGNAIYEIAYSPHTSDALFPLDYTTAKGLSNYALQSSRSRIRTINSTTTFTLSKILLLPTLPITGMLLSLGKLKSATLLAVSMMTSHPLVTPVVPA